MNVQLRTLCMAMRHLGICSVIVWLTGLLELLGPFKAGRTTNMQKVFATGGFMVGAPPTERFPLFPGRTGPGNRMGGPGVGSSVRELKCITTDMYGYMDLRSGNHGFAISTVNDGTGQKQCRGQRRRSPSFMKRSCRIGCLSFINVPLKVGQFLSMADCVSTLSTCGEKMKSSRPFWCQKVRS